MKAVRWVLFGALLAAFVLFAIPNWRTVPVNLGTTVLDFNLPILLLLAFVLGWLPTLLMHWTARAAWRRRTAKVDRLLEEAQSVGPRTTPAAAAPVVPLSPYPVQAQPTIVPPSA